MSVVVVAVAAAFTFKPAADVIDLPFITVDPACAVHCHPNAVTHRLRQYALFRLWRYWLRQSILQRTHSSNIDVSDFTNTARVRRV